MPLSHFAEIYKKLPSNSNSIKNKQRLKISVASNYLQFLYDVHEWASNCKGNAKFKLLREEL